MPPDPTRRMVKTKTPGVYRRGERYVVVWKHKGRQHKEYFRTYSEAREAKGLRQSGERRPQSRVGFEDYFRQWIEGYAGRTERGFSDTTRPEYRRPIERHALPRWGGWRLAAVEPADVRELFAAMAAAGVTASGIKKLRAALSVMYATAVEDDRVRSNPVRGVRIPQADGPDRPDRPHALTRAELGVLLDALPAGHRLFFELLAHTGLRISEAVGLTWQHVELGDRAAVLVREQVYRGERKRLKSGHARREIPLSAGMASRLLAHRRDSYRGEDRPVFASAAGGPLHPSNVRNRVLAPAARSVGLDWVGFHTFRHTCASLLFEAGKDVKQVQEWLGHADPGFTLRTYVHLMDDGLGSADFLDGAVRSNPGATEHPQTAASEEGSTSLDTAP